MGGHGWAKVAADGHGLGMGTNSKENVGLCSVHMSQVIMASQWGIKLF
jgi:hypothetical protein